LASAVARVREEGGACRGVREHRQERAIERDRRSDEPVQARERDCEVHLALHLDEVVDVQLLLVVEGLEPVRGVEPEQPLPPRQLLAGGEEAAEREDAEGCRDPSA
jgi:hypothetical protein